MRENIWEADREAVFLLPFGFDLLDVEEIASWLAKYQIMYCVKMIFVGISSYREKWRIDVTVKYDVWLFESIVVVRSKILNDKMTLTSAANTAQN